MCKCSTGSGKNISFHFKRVWGCTSLQFWILICTARFNKQRLTTVYRYLVHHRLCKQTEQSREVFQLSITFCSGCLLVHSHQSSGVHPKMRGNMSEDSQSKVMVSCWVKSEATGLLVCLKMFHHLSKKLLHF